MKHYLDFLTLLTELDNIYVFTPSKKSNENNVIKGYVLLIIKYDKCNIYTAMNLLFNWTLATTSYLLNISNMEGDFNPLLNNFNR